MYNGGMGDELKVWLTEELKKRGWSHSELARRAGISQFAVSSTLAGTRNAGADFCLKVALALDELPEKVFRMAGLLPALPAPDDPNLTELRDLVENLPPAKRKQALDYLKFLYQQGE